MKQSQNINNSIGPQPGEKSLVKRLSFWKSKEKILLTLAILIISFIPSLPSLQNGFVNWAEGVSGIFRTFVAAVASVLRYHLMLQRLPAMCRSLAPVSIKAEFPSGNAPTT